METNLYEEIDFGIDELFFSITDLKGNIESSNDIFVKISEYSKSELVSSPHSIIRHQEMPSCVFKLLWEYIQNQKAVVAYVVNKTKSGKSYWVIGSVFPLNDKYISIRIKPTSAIFKLVQELYPILLEDEKINGIDSSLNLLLTIIKQKGFDSYDSFMNYALLEEFKSRNNLIKEKTSYKIDTNCKYLEDISLKNLCHSIEKNIIMKEKIDSNFANIDTLQKLKTLFEQSASNFKFISRDLLFLSLNSSIIAAKLDKIGETFSILAKAIRESARENEAITELFEKDISALNKNISEKIFYTTLSSFQIEMVLFFSYELINKFKNDNSHEDEKQETFKIVGFLNDLIKQYLTNLHEVITISKQKIVQTNSVLDGIQKNSMFLNYINIYMVQ
ncbi:MAG: PAS domain S-box protein [Campylobacterales bacterium]|nr:PAS domain S-box protein [Campylobacterales bacterium]